MDQFYIIDFDRTLARTDDLRLLFESVAFRETSVPAEQIKEGELIYKNNFDVVRYLRDLLAETMTEAEVDDTIEHVKRRYLEQAVKEDLLEPYATDLLDGLRTRNAAFGILTTGSDEWQRTKIEASGLNDIPHLVIGTAKKSELMARWKRPDGIFILPDQLTGMSACQTEKIIFVDDKPVSFSGIPEGVEGVWVLPLRSAVAYDIDKLEVPTNVRHARGLKEVCEYLFEH